MSETKKATDGVAPAQDGGKDRTPRSERFTPLRSYATRTPSLPNEPNRELALSPLIPVPRLQG